MMRNSAFLLTNLLLVMTVLRCATEQSIAGGGTVVTNSYITGLLVTDQGAAATQTEVVLVPVDYDPVTSAAGPLTFAYTGNDGRYVFQEADTGTYNIQARQSVSGFQALITGVRALTDTTRVSTGRLTAPGNLQIIFADTTDTAGRYVYIKGTTLHSDFSTVNLFTGNHYAILFEAVPAAQLPAVLFAAKTGTIAPLALASAPTVLSNSTITIGDPADTLKPLWQFSCIVAVTAQTSSYYGGLPAMRTIINNQIQTALQRFNTTNNFNGELSFVIDSIYAFATDVQTEIAKPFPGFDYRLVYNAYSTTGDGFWYDTARTMYMEWGSSGLFTDNNNDVLTWMLGMTRGCVGLNWLNVKAENNPVNGQAYNGIRSIMNWCYGETVWDEFSINAINYFGKSVVGPTILLSIAYPSSIGVTVTSATGIPVAGARVAFYKVEQYSYAVDTPSVVSGYTDASGEFVLLENPFLPAPTDTLLHLNFLVSATYLNDTAYSWMPFNEVGNAWFADPDKDYKVLIHF